MTNSADPDQLASSEANWSGSALFAKTGHVVFSKRRDKCILSVWMKKKNGEICSLLFSDILMVDHQTQLTMVMM